IPSGTPTLRPMSATGISRFGSAPRDTTSRQAPRTSFTSRGRFTPASSGCAGTRTRRLPPSQQCDFRFGQFAPFADREIADPDWPYGGPHEFQHFAAEGFDHTPHLPVSAFRDGHFQIRVFGAVS